MKFELQRDEVNTGTNNVNLVFHKTSREPFTVTYTVDAVARVPNQ